MGSRLNELCIDCADPELLARFWCAVLGWQEAGRDAETIEIAASPNARPTLLFVRVPEPKSVKNRLHLDVNPSGCDQAVELERLLGLGAHHVDIGQGEQSWI